MRVLIWSFELKILGANEIISSENECLVFLKGGLLARSYSKSVTWPERRTNL